MTSPLHHRHHWQQLGWLFVALAVIACILWWMRSISTAPGIPPRFARDLPEACTQVVLVRAPGATATTGDLWLLERSPGGVGDWRTVEGPIAVAIGRGGLAWGAGEHRAPMPEGFRTKQEGDGCSPAGIFRLPFAFGQAAAAPDIRLKYVPVTHTLVGVDDAKSRHYNQVVDSALVTPDWDSRETMLRGDGLYRWGAFVAHNPANTPGGGSCIFLHLWRGPGSPTAGCTAMAEADLLQVLRWLDPAREPRLVQVVAEW